MKMEDVKIKHKNTLLVATTGMGKILCYVLSDTLMDEVCFVIYPLVSLIKVSNFIYYIFDPMVNLFLTQLQL